MDNQISWMIGDKLKPRLRDFGEDLSFNDHKIKFVVENCRNKDVLDIGCVQHNPENYRTKYWLHKALIAVSTNVIGLDLYAQGVEYLCQRGFHIITGDAQGFVLDKKFDVIVAGDLIEHLENIDGFFESCKNHLNKDGKILISTPNPWYWKNIVKAMLFSLVKNNPEHSLWLCPVTLAQVARRHGLEVVSVKFGSRYILDRILPLPRGIKHTSFHAVLVAH